MQVRRKLELDICDLEKGTFHTMPVLMQQHSSGCFFFSSFFLLSEPRGTCQSTYSSATFGCHHISVWCVSRESLVLQLGLGQPILSSVLVTRLSVRKRHPNACNEFLLTASVPGAGSSCLTSERGSGKTKVPANGLLSRSL